MRKIPACREIIRLASLGCSDKKISEITGAARITVKKVREQAVAAKILWPLDNWMDDEKIYFTLFPPREYNCKKKKPDIELMHYKLQEDPVKINLYDMYSRQCRDNGETPVKYSRFCGLLKEEEKSHRVTEDVKIKQGESLVVFWMEYPVKILERKTEKAYVLMGILPYSQNVFVRGYKDRGVKTWIKANSDMLLYFDGAPKEMMVRGMRSGISRCMTNLAYVQMIEYYGIIRTKDSKKRFEAEIAEVEAWFRDKLEGKKFNTLAHLNEVLEECRDEFLQEPVKGEKTRNQIFLKDEKPYLRELPEDAYYACIRKPAQIQRNSHVAFEKRYYSVPCQFLLQGKTKVELEATSKKVLIYYNDVLIAEHPNMKKSFDGTYSTRLEHMPSDEEELSLEWNKMYFLKRADRVGKNTCRVIELLMGTKPIRQQTYRVCDMILRLGKEYTYAKLEAVCAKIKYVKNGSVYKTIEDELKAMNR